jgi:hypothetical protein
MGYQELFAQQTFAEETETITHGAAVWQDPPEIRLEKVQADGFLVIRRTHPLELLSAPWPFAQPHDEVMLELKLVGNHLDRKAIERALLRRQARQLQRLDEVDDSWLGEEPLWVVASHLPKWLDTMREPACFAPGCYWIEPQWQRFLWIAANELPLVDELIPFLLARSGRALDQFCRWVALRRPPEWMLAMLTYLPVSIPTREQLLARLAPVDDPEVEARRKHILHRMLDMDPLTKQELIDRGIERGKAQGKEQGMAQGIEQGMVQGIERGIDQGRLSGARAALRRVLARRQLAPNKGDEARIDACTDLATLDRWLDQAITAASVSDALA